MRGRPLPVVTVAIAFFLLVASGCSSSSSSAPSLYPWSACGFLTAGDVDAVDGGQPNAHGLQVSSSTNYPWPSGAAAPAWPLRTAESRCEYPGSQADASANLAAYDVALAARLSGSDDRSIAGIESLLASEGYPTLTSLSVDQLPMCVTAALWASFKPDDQGTGAAVTRRGELHVLLSIPPAATAACGAEAVTDGFAPLYAYLVLFVTTDRPGTAVDDQAFATELMAKIVPRARMTMKQIYREPLNSIDGGDGGKADVMGSINQPEAGAASVSLADFPAAAGSALCQRLNDCCSPAERAGSALPTGASVAECAGFLSAAYGVALSSSAQSMANGQLAYDPSAASHCLDQYRSTACAALKTGTVGVPCLSAFTPLSTLGVRCRSDIDCVTEYCHFDASGDGGATSAADAGRGTTTPSGTCVARAAVGASCEENAACDSGRCSSGLCVQATPAPWCQGI